MPVLNDAARGFAAAIVAWQKRHGRHDLPWQKTRDAYRVWLSEIMLQQTQVATVIPYYARFLERFPSVDALARAPQEAVLESWAGLGYYARARNLHRCAQVIVAEHGGRFPRSAAAIAQLPGIGRSTAAAIAAFAFGERAAIHDGNVNRVLARCFAIEGAPSAAQTERQMWSLAESLLPAHDIESYTQGLMDLGATLCSRHQPRCAQCPLAAQCVAQASGRQAELPVARPTKTLPERRTTLLVLCDGERVLLERRPPAGIWGGLLVPPEAAGADGAAGEAAEAQAMALRHGCRLLETRTLATLRHSFSHFRLDISTLLCLVAPGAREVNDGGEGGWQWLPLTGIGEAALPAPIRVILERVAQSA